MTLTIPQQQELRHVEAYDLATFLQGFEQAVKDGYSLSLEHNETYPYGTIGHYIVKMVPNEWNVKQGGNTLGRLELKIDTSDVQKIVDEALATVQKAQEASELEKVVQSTSEELKATVEAPKKAGRPAKAK